MISKAPVRLAIAIMMLVLTYGCRETFAFLYYLDGGENTLILSPGNSTLTTNCTTIFAASGGKPPYTYSVASGPGTIHPDTGSYTSTSGGKVVINATDSLFRRGDTNVEVYETSATGVWISPSYVHLDKGEAFTFCSGGGDGSYTYTLNYGDGSVNSATGKYTAADLPSGSAAAVVEVEDGTAAKAHAIISIQNPTEPFSVTPIFAVMYDGDSIDFTASGAAPPVSWDAKSTASGPTMPDGTSSTYTPTSTGFALIFAIDSDGFEVIRPVLILQP